MSEIKVAKNGKATLACEMPDKSYLGKWSQNGKELKNDGKRICISHKGAEHELVIVKTKKSDEGKITFKSNKGGFEVDFDLIITEPPSVDPEEFEKCGASLEEIKVGSPATLKVPFTGASPIQVTWKFNGKKISSNKRYSIKSTNTYSSLTIDNFQAPDCGSYEVLLENQFGNMKIPVEVSLSDVSKINYSTVTVPGETIETVTTMDCQQVQHTQNSASAPNSNQSSANEKKSATTTAVGSTAAVQLPSKPTGSIKFSSMAANRFAVSLMTTAKASDVTDYVIERSGGGESGWVKCGQLTPGEKSAPIENLKPGQRYTFRVRARNAAGESEALESRAVTVQKPSDPPTLDTSALKKLEGVQNFKSGKDFRVKIPYKGFPLPIAQWTKNGKKMAVKGRIAANTNDNETTLTISGLTGDDSGEYSLQLKNKEGSANATFNVVVVDVPGAPIGPLQISDVSGAEMTLSWLTPKSDGGKPITGYSVEQKDNKSPNWTPVGKVEPGVVTFIATGLTKGLKYSFRVKAVNEEGESKPLISQPTLASGPPGPTGAPTAADVSSTAIAIQWSAPTQDGGSDLSGYSVEMRENDGDWVHVSNTCECSATVNNLTAENKYEFRVAPKNSSGVGKWTQTDNPIIAMDKPEPPIIEENVKESFSAPVILKAGDDLELKVPASGIPRPKAIWKHNTVEIDEKDSDATSQVSKEGVATLRIPNIQRANAGSYELILVNSEGEAQVNTTVKVTDIPAAPTAPMKIFKASSKLIAVKWEPTADDGDCEITKYAVEMQQYGDDGDVKSEWKPVCTLCPGDDLTASLDKVKKGQSYRFRVSAHNNMGQSPYLISEPILADDKFKPPASVEKPTVTGITKSSCVVSWTAPEDGGSPINGYLVEVKRVGRRNWIVQNDSRLVYDTSFKVDDLTEGGEYVVRVTADNEAGAGPAGCESDVIVAADEIPPPPPPTNVEVVDKTDSTVTLQWTESNDIKPNQCSGYYVERRAHETNDWVRCNDIPVRSTRYKISGLEEGKRFNFRVRPVNDGGFGDAHDLSSLVEVRQIQEIPKINFDSKLQQTIQVPASGSLRLMASISGKPAPVIRWQKDGIDLDKRGLIQTTGGVTQLTIRNLCKGDSGNYYLIAENCSGEIRKAVNVTVNDAPDPPCNIKIGEIQDDGSLLISWDPPTNDGGNPIKYYCLQKRDAYSRSFQTIKDKITGTSCLVSDLKPGFTYYFRIIAENELGRGDGTQSNLLTVVQKRGPLEIERTRYGKMDLSKPSGFSLSLKPLTISERRTARFMCAVVGKPEPLITWFKDGVRIKANYKYSMQNSYGVCTLVISDCRSRDAGIYMCEARNPSGKATCEANLVVSDVN